MHLAPRDRLSFPAGVAPGFDPTHIAARGISAGRGFSAVAMGGGAGLINLLSGAPASNSSGPITRKHLSVGPVYNQASALGASDFAGQSIANDNSVTFAAIVVVDTLNATFGQVIFSSTGLNGWYFGVSQTNFLECRAYPNGEIISSIPVLAGVPYFAIVSVNGTSGIDWLLRRLDTGAVLTATTSSAASSAPTGAYTVGNWNPGTIGFLGSIAAVMFGPNYLSPSAMRAWSEDPWSFWYPRREPETLGGGGLTAVALAALSRFLVRARLGGSFASQLGARSRLAARGRPSMTSLAAIAATASIKVKAAALQSSIAGLAGRVRGAVKAGATAAGAATLAGSSRFALNARLVAPGAIALAAAAFFRVRAALAPATGSAGLQGRAAASVKARASQSAVAGLAGRVSSAVRARASQTSIAGLAGRAAVAAKARATAAGAAALAASSRFAVTARLVPPGAIALVAAAFIRVRAALAPPQGVTSLQARASVRSSAKGSAAAAAILFGRAQVRFVARASQTAVAALLARVRVQGTARPALSVSAALAALAGRAAIRTTVRGWLALSGLFVASPRSVTPPGESRKVTPAGSSRRISVSSEDRSA